MTLVSARFESGVEPPYEGVLQRDVANVMRETPIAPAHNTPHPKPKNLNRIENTGPLGIKPYPKP